jgi:hypothetical protein
MKDNLSSIENQLLVMAAQDGNSAVLFVFYNETIYT